MKYLLCICIGYVIGCINPSYILSRVRGFDIRKKGSGNAGASNALIVMGKKAGFFCALFDIVKACIAIGITSVLFPDFSYAFVLTAAFCILGHIFPFYMKFRGGKGLASLGGSIMMFDWRVFLLMLLGEVILALVTNYICVVPMTASFLFAFIYGFMRRDFWGALLLLMVACVILIRHRENIMRIKKGTEAKLSFLWKREEEIERIKNNMYKPK